MGFLLPAFVSQITQNSHYLECWWENAPEDEKASEKLWLELKDKSLLIGYFSGLKNRYQVIALSDYLFKDACLENRLGRQVRSQDTGHRVELFIVLGSQIL